MSNNRISIRLALLLIVLMVAYAALGICSGEEARTRIPVPTSGADVGSSVLAQSECSGNSMGNCVTSDQFDTAYSYDPNEIVILDEYEQSIRGQEYLNDRLSDLDLLLYKSRDAGHWQASDQDTLKQILFIHRHGDRTPINFPPKDEMAKEPFWQFHGLGQLTNRGKARLHLLGKIVRQRYDKFLNGSVNKNSRKSRASGALRCIESSQVFLSSFLALDMPDSPDAASLIWGPTNETLSQVWQPASVNTLAAKYDGMLNEGAQCKELEAEFANLDETDENKQLLVEYKQEADLLKKELDFDVDHFYKWFWASSVLEIERSYFESKVKPALLAIYDRLRKAGERAFLIYQSTQKSRRLRTGLLMHDIIKNMIDFRDSVQSPFNRKFVHYSAHDTTMVFLLGVMDNFDKFPHWPDYASNLMIELHQDHDEWFLKIFYMPHVPTKPNELHIETCERGHQRGRCTLDKFNDLMQKYKIASWSQWMKECGNSLDDMDPYDPNS